MRQAQRWLHYFRTNILLCSALVFAYSTAGQQLHSTTAITDAKKGLAPSASFIENKGQYGKQLSGYEAMGQIEFGFEGFEMPVLFTKNGLIYLQRKVEKIPHEEEEALEKLGLPEEEIEQRRIITERTLSMRWLGANPRVEIFPSAKTTVYHTYFSQAEKAYGYETLTYKNLYNGIDLVYHFTTNTKTGFEYSLLVRPGADIGQVRMQYDGDVKKIEITSKGNLLIRSDIGSIEETIPVSYYSDKILSAPKDGPASAFTIERNEARFVFPSGYDAAKALVIDPFVSATGSLTGLNAGKAKDVDFDYAGNIYVTGGGSGAATHQLAKYNAAGALQWTFNGSLTVPSWSFGTYWGGWMVEKPTGNIYLGQGFNPTTGFQVIRVNTTGLYDNYITTANPNFREAWKMLWNCNGGTPQILVAGGGTNSNINFGVFTPPATAIGSLNVTGIPYTGSAGWAQDIVDFIIDPSNNDMYTIYGSLFGNPSLTNRIYKNTAPYSGASVAWNVASGFVSVQEIQNRPYLAGGSIDNSANIFAINASYLYYWDGRNLKAFNKATGAGAGTPLTTANATLMQGGIIADACNNIFVGDINGTIKVYNFNGAVFNDAAAPDISIPGFAGRAVYDLAYDDSKKLLYASGDGFVASIDVSAYCPNTVYTLTVTPNCLTSSATVTVSPVPPGGSTVTYTLYNGTVQIATNTTGVFTGLLPNISYTVIATINLPCSGTRATSTFTMPGPVVTTVQTNTTCGNSTGSVTATGSGSTGPYAYSIDGTNFQASGTFAGLAAGVYTVTVRDANGCKTITVVTILNSNGPSVTYTAVNADCGNNAGNITVNVTGGTPVYQYNINGGPYQSSNFFTGLLAGTYTITVNDAAGCTNSVVVTISSSPGPQLTAVPASATCGSSNGTITAFGSGGTAPLQYSINGNIFQASGVFTNITPGAYTVTVKDANNCIRTITVTVGNSPAPAVSAATTPAACGNINGTITATGTGGIAPLQYSINGTVFQSGNIFTGLAPGTYTITVKDATGCTNITTITVGSTGGPSVTASTVTATCGTSNGSITAVGSGGTPAYNYSINGINFQVSGTFGGLAAGSYIVYVRDAAGCIGTIPVTISNTASPSITAVSTASSCTVMNGTITATGSGGTGALQYSIDGITYQAGNVFAGLAPGTYTVYVRDANGCVKTTTTIVGNASNLALTASTINSSCSSSNGTITATATGGVGILQYSINGVTYQAGNIFSGLTPGTYTVYVRDANNCIISTQVVVGSSGGITIVVSSTDANCGGANGTITVSGSGGVAPLTYSINGTVYQSSGIFLNVAPGTYTVYVKDASGCISTQTVTLTTSGVGPGISTFTVRTKNAYPCGDNVGKIDQFRVNGGTCGTCTYSINFGPYLIGNEPVWSNLAPGTYLITARDANGCTKTIQATIGIAVNSTASATVTGTSCSTSTGTITLTGIGPNTPYHASISGIGGPWITFDPNYTFTGLAPGIYTIILSDDESFDSGVTPPDPGLCLDTIYVTVSGIGGPTLSTTVVNTTCGGSNGSITATGSGSTGPYTYSIDGGSYLPGNIFTNLAPGTYNISVMDGGGCVAGVNVTVGSSGSISLTAFTLPTSCGTPNGTITATASGGTAPFGYSINGTTFQPGNVFTNLSAGTYTLFVKDAFNCYTTLIVTVANGGSPRVTAFTVAATCNNSDGIIVASGSLGTPPYTFSIDGTVYQSNSTFAGLAAGFYTVYIKDSRGCISTTGVSVANLSGPTITLVSATTATCGNPNGGISVTAAGGSGTLQYSIDGVNFQTGNSFPGLLPGTYTVTVKDANGCLATRTVLVGSTNGPQTLTAVVVNAACGLNNGTITVTASGGVGALQYSINGTIYQVSNVFNGVAPGTYTLYVRDVNTCIRTLPVTVINLPGPAISASSSPASCGLSDGTITANATGGTGVLQYSINGGTTYQASNIFLGLAAGTYTVIVRDGRGCSATVGVTVNTGGSAVTPTFTPVAPICSGGTLTALPTTSLNGITGTWAPVLNNTATTIYTFTPTAGQCATTATLTITVNPNITPTFTAVAPICSGGTLTALPTTSLNGITGTWSPALNNTATTIYTFTPTAGQCATTATLTITVNPNVTPTFMAVPAICSGQTLTALPTTSLNGITGTWGPALNNTATTTYTFTPTAGQCATTGTLTITVNSNVTPTFTAVPAICSGQTLTALPTTSLNGITGTWSPALNNTATTTYTFTATAGQCATTATLTITVNSNVAPTFTAVAPICSGGTLTALPTTSNNGITGTWSPALNNTATTTYTFTPTAGQCATTATLTITVNSNVTPTFTAIPAICSGQTLTALPTTSLNGITGSWSPALNNTATTVYTFTPTAGQCATTATLTITVNPNVTPTFAAVAAICSGGTLTALPTTSLNGITGTWSPALNNTATTIYTFTPTAGQCATTTTLTITVNSNVTPTFAAVAPICSGGTLTALPTTSLNGITGTWSPVLNNTATTTYTFTPTAGQCATTTTLTITVNPNITPTFAAVAPICSGGTLAALPTTSLNGITGTWAPALNNTATTTYTFTATAGQCATTTTLTITVNPNITPTFAAVAPICSGGTLTALPTTSLNGITGTWAPALNNTITTVYTFTPTAGQCATTATLTITVNPIVSPTVNCGVSTTSSVSFIWAAVVSATGYNVSYQVNANAPINVGSIGNVLSYVVTGLAGGDAVIITVTATGGAGTCFTSSSVSCTATACTPPAAIINYGSPYCNSNVIAQAVTLTGTGAYTGGTFSSTAGLTINSSTGAITPSTSTAGSYTVTYTVAASAGCPGVTATTTVVIDPVVTPTFTAVAAICSGQTLTALPTTSLNGITGTWSPALNNTATTTYTFTPTAGQCATTTTLTITVNPNATPTFTAVPAICSGQTLTALPTTSLNGITGSWAPALNNTTTTTYTFTPALGQCATTATMTITVNANVTPTFTAVAPVCSGETLAALPTNSNNGITGTWSPALNNTATTTYTFTPTVGQCATTATMTITVNSNVTPTFTAVPAICSGQTLTALPTISLNGITGTWSPALNNTTTTTYTFTPTSGQCAMVTTLIITVNSTVATPVVNIVQPSCAVQSGSVVLTSSAAGLLFSLDGGPYAAYPAGGYTGLAPGTHTLTAQNISGCSSPLRIITINPLVASPTVTAVSTNTSCTSNTGTITASGAGGNASYRYSINGINFQNSNIFTGLAANNYTVTVRDANNCTGTVQVTVGFNNNLTVNAGTNKTICEGEAVQLAGSTNATSFGWSPSAGLSSTTILNPIASPRITSTYTLTATTGVCTNTSTVTVFVKPAPTPYAGPDQKVCYGQSIQLQGSGGVAYQWSPASNLSDALSPNPYILSSGYGNLVYYLDIMGSNGCRSLKKDTVNIRILPPVSLFAGNDTAVAINQPLQLNATDLLSSGLQQYTWSPGAGLSNPLIKNPVFAMNTPGTYTYLVSAVTADRCPAQDEITIVVYLRPEIFVPNAFTPGNGGPNDIFRPILKGMKKLINFSVFNRYGELVYFTTEQGKGWDGLYKGLPQNTGAYVWVAEALDYAGKIHKKKGSVVLIR